MILHGPAPYPGVTLWLPRATHSGHTIQYRVVYHTLQYNTISYCILYVRAASVLAWSVSVGVAAPTGCCQGRAACLLTHRRIGCPAHRRWRWRRRRGGQRVQLQHLALERLRCDDVFRDTWHTSVPGTRPRPGRTLRPGIVGILRPGIQCWVGVKGPETRNDKKQGATRSKSKSSGVAAAPGRMRTSLLRCSCASRRSTLSARARSRTSSPPAGSAAWAWAWAWE